MDYKVNITGLDTSKLTTLTSEETIELFNKFHEGDMNSKDILVNGNLKLVLSLLKRFNNGKYNMDDLFQVGVIGLIKAIDNFDLSYNLKLSTYAVPLILGEIKRYIRDNMSLRVSRGTKDLAYQIIKFKEDYLNQYGEYPKDKIVMEYFSLPEYRYVEILNSLKDPVSIYEVIYDDGGDTIYLEDQISDHKLNKLEQDELISLKKGLQHIKEREKEILLSRYLYGKTQIEIADSLGISQAQVSRLEKGAIKQLKKVLK